MDVSCNKCGARYRVDERRVPDAGLNITCGNCNHVVQARRPQAVANAHVPPEPSRDEWFVRRADGRTRQVRDLATLQRWVVEGEVCGSDDISKAGSSWHRLDSMNELAPFFRIMASAPSRASQRAAPASAATGPGYGDGPCQVSDGAWEVTARNRGPGPSALEEAAEAPGAPGVPADIRRAIPEGAEPRPSAGPAQANPSRRGAVKVVALSLLVLLLVVAGGLGVIYVRDPARVMTWIGRLRGVEAKIGPLMAAGYEALQRDTAASIAEAAARFERATSIAPRHGKALAGLAEARLALANAATQSAERLAQRAEKTPEAQRSATEQRINTKRAEAEALRRVARRLAERAQQAAPLALETRRALAEVFRQEGAVERVYALLGSKDSDAAMDPRSALVRGAALAADETRADEAKAELTLALTQQPGLHQARYVLAEVMHQDGNTAGARGALEKIVAAEPEHERARALLEFISEPPAAPEPPAEPEEKPRRVSAGALMAQADRLREADQAGSALKLYLQALELDNSDPDILTGLGWCHYDLENYGAASLSFERALRLAPRFSDAHFGLAEAFRAGGNVRGAVKHFQAYLEIMPDGPDALVARRVLKTLKR